jgi:hypothetical protein
MKISDMIKELSMEKDFCGDQEIVSVETKDTTEEGQKQKMSLYFIFRDKSKGWFINISDSLKPTMNGSFIEDIDIFLKWTEHMKENLIKRITRYELVERLNGLLSLISVKAFDDGNGNYFLLKDSV